MLKSVTEQWEDRSTVESFQFVFFCDCCRKPLPSPMYEFQSGFRQKLLMSEEERRAREILWKSDHDAAYERANLYMFQNRIHSCESCGAGICGDCAWVCDELDGGVCCEKCRREKGFHGIKMWEGE